MPSRSNPMIRRLVTAAGLLTAALAAIHCGSDPQTACTTADCVGDASADAPSADGGATAPDGCDLSKPPKDSPACVEDSVGVFVAPTGRAGATGTKADPLRTIGEAVGRAAADGKPRVYVCEGSYESAITIAKEISIFGGLTCAWTPSPVRPRIAPGNGIAVRITSGTGRVLLRDLEIIGSADPLVPSDSAIAMFVSSSQDVKLQNVSLTAGPGTAGAKARTKDNYPAGSTAKNGANASAANGGPETNCACADGATSSRGARGATAGGTLAGSGSAVPAIANVNEGLTGSTTCFDGRVGLDGDGNAKGAAGAAASGALTASGWNAASEMPAERGEIGNPGQGGGGGGAKPDLNQGGGGGSCGGCGGGGGEPGLAGGSSFALLSFESKIEVDGGVFASAAGGRGGDGGDGQPGQAPGAPGGGTCNGGAGGIGGGGSGGGGGAGGHSVAVGYVGTEPKLNGLITTLGAKGSRGEGGAGGEGGGNAGAAGTPGIDGIAASTMIFR